MVSTVSVNIRDHIATITLNRPQTLNAITAEDYDAFANALREIDENEDVLITVWQASGKWFCAGTDVKRSGAADPSESLGSVRNALKNQVIKTTMDCGKALYSHTKILVAAVNGPVMGISAAFLGYFDFIYALPNAWLAVPFTFLGIIAEGGSSVSFVNRMGVGFANEVLLWGKKKTADQLCACGFYKLVHILEAVYTLLRRVTASEIFPEQSTESFHSAVRQKLLAELDGLDPKALLAVRSLIRRGWYIHIKALISLFFSTAQAERFASGVPHRQFARIAESFMYILFWNL